MTAAHGRATDWHAAPPCGVPRTRLPDTIPTVPPFPRAVARGKLLIRPTATRPKPLVLSLRARTWARRLGGGVGRRMGARRLRAAKKSRPAVREEGATPAPAMWPGRVELSVVIIQCHRKEKEAAEKQKRSDRGGTPRSRLPGANSLSLVGTAVCICICICCTPAGSSF